MKKTIILSFLIISALVLALSTFGNTPSQACANMENEMMRKACFSALAGATASTNNDIDHCNTLTDKSQRDTCLAVYSTMNYDPKGCDLMRDSLAKDHCYENANKRTLFSSNRRSSISDSSSLNSAYFNLLFIIAMFIYLALVLSTLSKKMKIGTRWHAWVPGFDLYLMSQLSKINFLIFVGVVVINFIVPNQWIVLIANIWLSIATFWKIAEARKMPGWYGILTVVPVLNFIIMGVITWSDKKVSKQNVNKKRTK